ncbi:hypothetical protein C8F04DRAFT_1181375 [Mycena alexandri]|uniref:Uncharacterized protein n=1 Tax=Mycena alexandri TaxID=1745969 RepID=A0AAD6SYF8_9AGAR|nr:hypothetical protein C8F04DRAFT_1181375 [Mycena alexandri]
MSVADIRKPGPRAPSSYGSRRGSPRREREPGKCGGCVTSLSRRDLSKCRWTGEGEREDDFKCKHVTAHRVSEALPGSYWRQPRRIYAAEGCRRWTAPFFIGVRGRILQRSVALALRFHRLEPLFRLKAISRVQVFRTGAILPCVKWVGAAHQERASTRLDILAALVLTFYSINLESQMQFPPLHPAPSGMNTIPNVFLTSSGASK